MEKVRILSERTLACPAFHRSIYKLGEIIFTMVLLLCISFAGKAQTPLDATLSENGSGQLMYVLLPDSSISEIDVELGSKQSLTDLFDGSFVFDQSNGLPTGLSYSRTGLQVYLGLGNFSMPSAYFARIRLKNASGTWSDWYEFIGN